MDHGQSRPRPRHGTAAGCRRDFSRHQYHPVGRSGTYGALAKKRAAAKRPGLRRFVLDTLARTPLTAKVVTDKFAPLTTIVVSKQAPKRKLRELAKTARVLVAPAREGKINLPWLLHKMGSEEVTSLLVEGGGEINASFLLGELAQRIAFFYAPKILGGASARKAVAGGGARGLDDSLALSEVEWTRVGADWLLQARIGKSPK